MNLTGNKIGIEILPETSTYAERNGKDEIEAISLDQTVYVELFFT